MGSYRDLLCAATSPWRQVEGSPLLAFRQRFTHSYICAIFEKQMCTMCFKVFLYFILSVSCVCHHQQTSAEIPISQQACSQGIKRSRSKKIHSSINVQSILSDDKVIHKVNRCLARYSPRTTTTNRPTNRALNKPAWPGPN